MQPIFIQEFLPKDILNIAYSYCLLKYQNKSFIDSDTQSNSLIKEHSDFLMETLLEASKPVIEKNVSKELFPTYSFLRIYDKGSDLKVHTDRESCEYTVALCLGAEPQDKPYNLFVGERDKESEYKYFSDKNDWERYRIDHKFSMLPNNAVIFQGMEKIHWREYCEHDHFITVFLHYVDKSGPYKEWKFDKRNNIGIK